MICMTCRGLGMPGGCPGCAKDSLEPQTQPTSFMSQEKVSESLAIPEFYKDRAWSKQHFLDAHADARNKTAYETYAERLTKIHQIFSSGRIPNKSFFVIAPQGMGKMTWAYSCMQEAVKFGHSVVPIIDNTQYKRLNIISSDRLNSKLLKASQYSIEDYNNADVLFMTVDPDNFQSSYRTIESVLSKRARIGKPTFVLSRFTLSQMSLLDYTGEFSKNISAEPARDNNKYIVIIGG